jgi:hypothetical protein
MGLHSPPPPSPPLPPMCPPPPHPEFLAPQTRNPTNKPSPRNTAKRTQLAKHPRFPPERKATVDGLSSQSIEGRVEAVGGSTVDIFGWVFQGTEGCGLCGSRDGTAVESGGKEESASCVVSGPREGFESGERVCACADTRTTPDGRGDQVWNGCRL